MQNHQLRVAILQSDLVWENPEENRTRFTTLFQSLSSNEIDLVVLPEMFTSGFTMNATFIAEFMNGTTMSWLKKIATQKKFAIAGSLAIKENSHFFNRFVFVKPNGKTSFYDKRHTFTLAGESQVYKAGKEKIIINYKGWKICPQICYDLRFPVWARNTEDYDLLIYVANWPKARINAWDALLKARAIENMSYCIGVNRVGFDANNYEYPGHSAIYDTLGQLISHKLQNKENIEIVTLNKTHIIKNRKKLGFLNDRDSFNLR